MQRAHLWIAPCEVQLYHAVLSFQTRLAGTGYMMHRWFFTSSVFGVALLMLLHWLAILLFELRVHVSSRSGAEAPADVPAMGGGGGGGGGGGPPGWPAAQPPGGRGAGGSAGFQGHASAGGRGMAGGGAAAVGVPRQPQGAAGAPAIGGGGAAAAAWDDDAESEGSGSDYASTVEECSAEPEGSARSGSSGGVVRRRAAQGPRSGSG